MTALGASRLELLMLLAAITCLAVLGWALHRTRSGLAWRSVAVDRVAAQICGVEALRSEVVAMTLGGLLAGAAGVLFSIRLNYVEAHMAEILIFKGFAIVVLAGIGRMGALLGAAVALAAAETVAIHLGAGNWANMATFVVILLVVWLRPQGLSASHGSVRA